MQTKRLSLLQRAAFGLLIASFGGAVLATAADEAFVVGKRAIIEGQINGSLQLIAEDGEIRLSDLAMISGDLLVPAKKSLSVIGGSKSAPISEAEPSSAVKIDRPSGGTNLKGSLRPADKFTAPAVVYSGSASGTRSVIVESKSGEVDFEDLGSLTVRHSKALVTVPAGSYNEFVVEQGALLLGFGAGREPLRYEFRKLNVGPGGRVLVAGPVVITVGGSTEWQGHVGNEENPFWLDMRVASGAVSLGSGAKFSGFLSAPQSDVTISDSAVFKGELVVERLSVGKMAVASAVSPRWTAKKGDGAAPAFSHRALHMQRNLPVLQERIKGLSFAAVAYPGDMPFVMISARPGSDKNVQAAHERTSLFEAFCALFEQTGFERAGVVLTSGSEGTATARPAARNVILTFAQFEQVLREVGGTSATDENIRAVRDDSELLERFETRALALGLAPTTPRH